MPSYPRPLSPHLQIYKPQWTSVLSILHRLTGVALSLGLLMFTWFLYAVSAGPLAFELFTGFLSTGIGRFMLMGWSFALMYHLCMGLRHFVFDTGRMLQPERAERAGQILLVVAMGLTLSLWFCVFIR